MGWAFFLFLNDRMGPKQGLCIVDPPSCPFQPQAGGGVSQGSEEWQCPQGEGQVLGTREKVTTGQERIGVETGLGIAWPRQVPSVRPKKMVSGAKRSMCLFRGEKMAHGLSLRSKEGLDPGQKSCWDASCQGRRLAIPCHSLCQCLKTGQLRSTIQAHDLGGYMSPVTGHQL